LLIPFILETEDSFACCIHGICVNIAVVMLTAIDPKIKITLAGKEEKSFQLTRFSGIERLSQPFDFQVTLVSNQTDFKGDKAVGKPMAIIFALPKGDRVFHGEVIEFTQDATVKIQDLPLTEYHVRLRPTLWRLSLGTDYRIYQNKTTIDIVKAILKENGVTDVVDKTRMCGHAVRPHCVHYGETFLDFVSRLCEEAGISYYFQHSARGHRLTLVDASGPFPPIAGETHIPLIQTFLEAPPFQSLLSCAVHERLVSKAYEARDYNPELPKIELKAHVQGKGHGGLIAEYPGYFSTAGDGAQLSKLRMQDLERFARWVDGESTALTLLAGGEFSVKGHPRSEVNKAYVLVSVKHQFTLDGAEGPEKLLYRNNFAACPKGVPIPPERRTRKNLIQGAQTAVVTGPSGAEIHRGADTALKVFFFWDRHGKKDDTSSWWIRCTQSLASHQFGAVFTPRVGDEVLVVFEGGDPERPIIVGSVYNGNNTPPYPEKEATKTGLKTHSSPQAKGYNEWYFDDNAGKELGYLYLQKDGEAFVNNNVKITIDKGDETRLYQEGSRTTKLEAKGDKEGNDTLHLAKGCLKVQIDKGNYDLNLKEGNAQFAIKGETEWEIEKSQKTTVKKDVVLTVHGDLTIKVSGAVQIQGEKDVTIKAGGGMTLKAGKGLLLQAGQGISLKSGQDTSIQAGKDIKQTASMNYTVKASMACKLEGQLSLGLKSGLQVKVEAVTIENQAQALFKGNAPMSMIGGGMVKLG
jgi:type VI secretion system secreted protein VgrG